MTSQRKYGSYSAS